MAWEEVEEAGVDDVEFEFEFEFAFEFVFEAKFKLGDMAGRCSV